MNAQVFDIEGNKIKSFELPSEIFDVAWNADLVKQVVDTAETNTRIAKAHTKMRGEVRGGGKKPWRQKGTGRARHGSRRSPIWVGGAVTFGPRNEKVYKKSITKKMKAKALASMLSQKARDGELFFFSDIDFGDTPKTKKAVEMFGKISNKNFNPLSKVSRSSLVLLCNDNKTTTRSLQNINNVGVSLVSSLNARDLALYRYIFMVNPDKCMEILTKRLVENK